MKRLLKLVLAFVAVFLIVKLCTGNLGSVISLPGGTSGSDSEDSGGWFSPKKDNSEEKSSNVDKSLREDAKDLEKELGIGTDGSSSTTITIPSTTSANSTASNTSSATSPLSFKGIPIKGSISEFGSELVKAGFKNAGNGTYTGDFAGYSGCKITPTGSNPVQEVRVDFPVISDWDTLEKAYDSLQASLTEKYGVEPKTSPGNNIATYSLSNGTITLDADVKEKSSWHVILKYTNDAFQTTTSTVKNPIDDL